MRPDGSLRGAAVRRYVHWTNGPSTSRFSAAIVGRYRDPLRGAEVLDAGSGTGLGSLPLAKRGARVTLLDASLEALAIARTYYASAGQNADFVEGSVFRLPFPDGRFDLVWNTGLIEHFARDERRRALREMLRVVKPQGVVITINPNARCRLYTFAKSWAERHGSWDVGREFPIETLAYDVDLDRYSLEEFAAGWFMQFHFLKYVLPRPLRLPYVATHELLQNVLNSTNRFPGYLLVSVLRRRSGAPDEPSPSDNRRSGAGTPAPSR